MDVSKLSVSEQKCVFNDNAQNRDMVVVHEKSLQNVQNYPLFQLSKQISLVFNIREVLKL